MQRLVFLLSLFDSCWGLDSPHNYLVNTPEAPTILLVCCLSLWTHIFISKYNVIPFQLIILFYTVVIMSVTQIIWRTYGVESNKALNINPFMLNITYFPIIVSNGCFSRDKYLLFKTLPSTFFITTVISGISISMHAALLKLMLYSEWTWLECIILALIFSTTQVRFLLTLLNDFCYKRFRAEAQGEAVITIGFVLIYFDITVGLYLGIHTENYGELVGLFFYKMFVGLLVGYIIGILTTFLIKLSSEDSKMCAITVLCTFLVSYIFIEFLKASPFFGMLSMGLVLMQYTDRMMEDNVIKMRELFKLLHFVANFTTFAYTIYIVFSWKIINNEFDIKNGFSNYCIIMLSRLCSFFIGYPILKWFMPNLNCMQLFMMIWMKVVNNTTLILTAVLLLMEDSREYARKIVNIVLVAALLTFCLNAISFTYFVRRRVLKRKSFNQVTNMIITLKYLYQQKDRYISMWKMKGRMGDVRWDVINELTDIKQPFKKDDGDSIYNQFYLISPRKATCPNCKRIVTAEHSIRDKIDLKIEVTRKILKEMEMNLVRMHSMGLISLDCMTVAKKMLAESESIFINVAELNLYFKSNKLLAVMKRIAKRICKFDEKSVKVPRKPFRRTCYRIIMNRYYRGLFSFLTFVSIYPIIVFAVTETHNAIYFSAMITNILFMLMFIFHMVITIYAYSFIYLSDGLRLYFSSYWHVFDLIIIIMAVTDVTVNIIFVTKEYNTEWFPGLYYSRLVRVVVILRVMEGQMTNLLKIFEEYVEVKIAFGFELVLAFESCYREVLMILDKIIVNNYDLEMEYRDILEKARWAVLDVMLLIQLKKPWVAINVKTMQVMRATTKHMYSVLNELKVSGFLNGYDYEKFKNNLKVVEMRCGSLGKKLTLGASEVLSVNPWINNDKEVFEVIWDSAMAVTFYPDQVICIEDDFLLGIYIILSGVLKLEYSPRVSTIDQLLNNGRLPIMDCIETNIFDRNRCELLLPGSSIGELSFLTDRPYDSKITAVNTVKALFIPNNTIVSASAHNCDIIDGLIARMWKTTIYNMCMWTLTSAMAYESFSRSEITQKLERAFVPNLQGYRMLNLVDDIEDVILIDGQIVNLLVKQTYNAPCYVPRTVTTFSVSFDSTTNMNTVILIIPMPDVNISSLMIELENQSVKANESDSDFKKRSSKFNTPNTYVKDVLTYTASTVFTPLEMLKKKYNQSNELR